MDKQFLALCGILLACGVCFWGGREYQKTINPSVVIQDATHPAAAAAARPPIASAVPVVHTPETKHFSFALLPGQAQNIPNPRFGKVEIHSEYPMRVLTGPCHVDYTVEFVCAAGPADIFITDVRNPPVFTTPKANTISVMLIE